MTWWQAIILGIVEGLTEYLPVSSTGHLILAQRAMGIGIESKQAKLAADAYAVCIQAGAIIAVLGLYWQRVRQSIVGWVGKLGVGPGDGDGFRLGRNLIVAFIPAAVLGKLLDEPIEQHLFGLWPVTSAWFVGGVAILAVVWWKRRKPDDGEHKGKALEAMTWQTALMIGLLQCLAMWPGTSRSLVTIVAGLMLGLSMAAAVEFSFLLGVITLLAATLYKSVIDTVAVPIDGQQQDVMLLTWMVHEYGWANMIIGSIAAWASAVIAVKWMVSYLKKHSLAVFGYYRVALAIVVAALILAGMLVDAVSIAAAK